VPHPNENRRQWGVRRRGTPYKLVVITTPLLLPCMKRGGECRISRGFKAGRKYGYGEEEPGRGRRAKAGGPVLVIALRRAAKKTLPPLPSPSVLLSLLHRSLPFLPLSQKRQPLRSLQ